MTLSDDKIDNFCCDVKDFDVIYEGRLKRVKMAFSGLRIRRPGVRIPPGVPNKKKDLQLNTVSPFFVSDGFIQHLSSILIWREFFQSKKHGHDAGQSKKVWRPFLFKLSSFIPVFFIEKPLELVRLKSKISIH